MKIKKSNVRELTEQEQEKYERVIAIINDSKMYLPYQTWLIYNIDDLITEILKNENN